jgi:methylglutaconyl-CoA hydratase
MNFSYTFLETLYISPEVLQISLNRPELHNAFNEVLISELTDIGKKLQNLSSIRVVVLTGKGKSFCAGADLNWMKKTKELSFQDNVVDATVLGTMFHVLDEVPQAVIGRINGSALGGGTGLISICDISIGLEQAKFGLTEVNLGIIPSVISPFVINKIGIKNAREFFLTGERFDGKTALSAGLLNYVVTTEEELNKKVFHLINELLISGPVAVKESKQLIREFGKLNMNNVLQFTSEKIAKIRISPEGQEGISSFLEKRKPNWVKKID